MNHGLTVRLAERAGFIWAIETTVQSAWGSASQLRAPVSGPATREFFFTPRNLGTFDVEFFLAKAFSPAHVHKTHVLGLTVKP